jgi:hypothetical protein
MERGPIPENTTVVVALRPYARKIHILPYAKSAHNGYYATVSEFEGELKVHIRKYVENVELGKVPTKYGIALNVDEWAQLNKTMDTLNVNLRVMSDSLTRRKKWTSQSKPRNQALN